MGIASWLANIGIRSEEAAHHAATRAGTAPLQWEAGQLQGSLIYRLTRDPQQRASLFSTVQTIVVNEGESAVVLEDGVSQGALEPGRYTFEKARVVGSLDIIWVKTAQQPLRWGVGNITSADNIQISGNGEIYVRVVDAVAFNKDVVQGAMALAEKDLQRLLMPRIQGVLRSQFTAWQALELQTKREEFIASVKSSLSGTFEEMGLGIVGFEITEINFPPEFKAVIAQATMTAHSGNAELIQAKIDAERRLLEAQTEAQAQLTSGMAQAQVMAQLQAQGIDPMQMKALDAVSTLAENPGQGGVHGDMPRVQLISQVAGAALNAPPQPQVPVQGQPLLPGGQQPPQPGHPPVAPAGQPGVPPGQPVAATPQPGVAPEQPAPPQASAAPPAPPAAAAGEDPAAKIAQLETQLDKLVDRLADGEISESMYEKLSARIEERLAGLKGG